MNPQALQSVCSRVTDHSIDNFARRWCSEPHVRRNILTLLCARSYLLT